MVQHPIWEILQHQGRSLIWLARRTGYSEDLILSVKVGRRNASSEFRAKCALALDIPEHLLFAERAVADQAPDASTKAA